jgi:SAM-dependent methyltransferase
MTRRPELPGYDAEAEFYDLCWSSLTDDIAFFRRRIGRPGRLLDLMCGTGRVGLALARAGWVVEGVDRSVGMLKVARSKLRSTPLRVQRKVRFHRADLAGFRLPTEFDAAVIPVNSFPLILSRRERVRALQNVHRHLARSGKLLVHLDTPRSYRSAQVGAPNVSVFRLGQGRRWYVRSLVEGFQQPDLVRGITHHLLVDRSGRVLRQVTTETRTRVLPVAELVRELSEAGFSSIRRFGDYSGARLARNSSFAVIEASA